VGIPAADPSEEPPVCGAEDMDVKSGSWIEYRWEIEIDYGMGRDESWVGRIYSRGLDCVCVEAVSAIVKLCNAGLTVYEKIIDT
jgi:hypothetical protein